MSIEWLEPSDVNGLLDVIDLINNSISNKAFFNWTRDSLTDELQFSKTLLLKIGPDITSFILFRELAESLEIMVLGTRPDQVKRSYMEKELQFLQKYAAGQDKKIHLEVHSANEPAIRLYRKCAFEVSHIRKDYYKDGGSAILYVWKNR